MAYYTFQTSLLTLFVSKYLNMKKLSLFLTVLVSAALLSACGSSASTSNSQTPTKAETAQTKTVTQSLKNIISAGTAQKCTWSTKDTTGEVIEGTILTDGKKFKQTTIMSIGGKSTQSTVINDGEYLYTWTDEGSGTGFKVKMSDTAAVKNPAGVGQPTQTVDMDKQTNYNCSPATVSDADFSIPSDIKFVDMANLQDSLKDINIPSQQ